MCVESDHFLAQGRGGGGFGCIVRRIRPRSSPDAAAQGEGGDGTGEAEDSTIGLRR